MTKMIQMAKVLNKYIPSEWAFKNQFNHGISNIVAESTFLDADLTGLLIAYNNYHSNIEILRMSGLQKCN